MDLDGDPVPPTRAPSLSMNLDVEPLEGNLTPIKAEESEHPVVVVSSRKLKRPAAALDDSDGELEILDIVPKARKTSKSEEKKLDTTPHIKGEPGEMKNPATTFEKPVEVVVKVEKTDEPVEPDAVGNTDTAEKISKVEKVETETDDELMLEGEARIENQYKLLVMHSDSIIDGRDAMVHTISQVFDIMMPDFPSPSSSEILSAILSAGPLLVDIYEKLGSPLRRSLDDTLNWFTRHRNIFQKKGIPMLCLYPEIPEFFLDAHYNDLPILILSNGHSRLVDSIFKKHDTKTSSIESVAGKRWMILEEAHTCASLPENIRNVFRSRIIPAYTVLERDIWRLNNPPEEGATTMPTFAPLTAKDVLWISCAPYNLHGPKMGYEGVKTCWINRTEYDGGSDRGYVDVIARDLDDVRSRVWKEVKY
ncbi:hypothetical protein B0H67DRAFT_580198 [Lasiosphaeris hirsuta]|uniref:Uncharacterized protein n=1 Tax=Lasiosphaeris hirsuta TaxID=260670 RepID=A0AA40AG37_9PEZI|nr:hypothetical protein B0H67DRAFT_580198 [Lasiosphaeris hirsuta]